MFPELYVIAFQAERQRLLQAQARDAYRQTEAEGTGYHILGTGYLKPKQALCLGCGAVVLAPKCAYCGRET